MGTGMEADLIDSVIATISEALPRAFSGRPWGPSSNNGILSCFWQRLQVTMARYQLHLCFENITVRTTAVIISGMVGALRKDRIHERWLR